MAVLVYIREKKGQQTPPWSVEKSKLASGTPLIQEKTIPGNRLRWVHGLVNDPSKIGNEWKPFLIE